MNTQPALPYPLLEPMLLADHMRAMDQQAVRLGFSVRSLMENAAQATVAYLVPLLAPGSRVVVCVGQGNNGGDGYAVARLLSQMGHVVTVVEQGLPTGVDSRANRDAWLPLGITLDAGIDPLACRQALAQAQILVDALFGTGLNRPLADSWQTMVGWLNASPAHIKLAVDVPSGVDADTGQIWGAAVRCTHTVTFQAAKPGLYLYPGRELAGEIHLADIGLPPLPLDHPHGPHPWRLTASFAGALLPQRPAWGHKGTFGHVLVAGGKSGMGGAVLLAALGALKTGSGLVSAAVPAALHNAFLAAAPEIMTICPAQGSTQYWEASQGEDLLGAAQDKQAWVLGCGLGRRAETQALIPWVVEAWDKPLVLDADGLYALQPNMLNRRRGPTVLTPHPGEMARLSGLSVLDIQADRMGVARRFAQAWNVVLVLKGSPTVVAAPDGQCFLNSTGDHGLATGGTGDVLAGMIGSLLAQGLEALPAALLGVYLHGLSRDCQREAGISAPFFTARDLIEGINLALQRLGAS